VVEVKNDLTKDNCGEDYKEFKECANNPLGNYVRVLHSDGRATAYAHQKFGERAANAVNRAATAATAAAAAAAAAAALTPPPTQAASSSRWATL
jgi:hypothetical protein